MMKNNYQLSIICVIASILAINMNAMAQQDSALNRSVTVERDFQPVIQAAGKVSTKPAVVETTIDPSPVEYSTYHYQLPIASYQSPNLLSQPTRFEPGKRYHGYVSGGLGHPNSLFDFGYHLDDGKNSILDVYAHHKAEWGLATLSKTKIGLDFTHPFSTCDLYFGVNGGNVFYHKYGHFYDYSATPGMWAKNKEAYAHQPLSSLDKTSLWSVEAFIGVKANAKQDLQYRVQTGYKLFSKPGAVSEHQLRTHSSFDWHADAHHVGAKIYMQNNFLQLGSLADVIPDSLYRSRHNFRIEPYYQYEGRRVRVHVGVNLDLNIGRGKNSLSGSENVSFAPSPHINLEAQVAKQWLTIYADITGRHALGSLQEYMEENRYRFIHAGIIEPHYASYTPVDAEIGFHIRPHRDLLIEIHGGYAYMMHEDVWVATADTLSTFAPLGMRLTPGDFTHLHTHYQRGKIGGQLNYHYRDIVRVNINGDYYFWKGTMPVYDRPNWDLDIRIDGRIDQHWSLYSDNRFVGSRLALATDGEHTLRPVIDLNLGLQYDMWIGKPTASNGSVLRPESKPNLSYFFQLNNWLHRKNEIYYGYRSQGINFLLGATYRF